MENEVDMKWIHVKFEMIVDELAEKKGEMNGAEG